MFRIDKPFFSNHRMRAHFTLSFSMVLSHNIIFGLEGASRGYGTGSADRLIPSQTGMFSDNASMLGPGRRRKKM